MAEAAVVTEQEQEQEQAQAQAQAQEAQAPAQELMAVAQSNCRAPRSLDSRHHRNPQEQPASPRPSPPSRRWKSCA